MTIKWIIINRRIRRAVFPYGPYKVVWPSGEARVCKTFHGGSIPPATSDKVWTSFIWQAIVRRGACLCAPYLLLQ